MADFDKLTTRIMWLFEFYASVICFWCKIIISIIIIIFI